MTRLPPIDSASRTQRRERIKTHPTQIGIDFVRRRTSSLPSPPGATMWRIELVLIPDQARSGKNRQACQGLTPAQIEFVDSQGRPARRLKLLELQVAETDASSDASSDTASDASSDTAADLTLHVAHLDFARDDATYDVVIRGVRELDPYFDSATFTLLDLAHAESPRESGPVRRVEQRTPVELDYQTRDFQGFRQMMLDRLSALRADWRDRHSEDATTVLVEALAYAADHLSYYQDAVATEAYVGSARQRVSLRRHAMLLGYEADEGCNARVWIHVAIGQPAIELAARTTFLSRLPASGACLTEEDWQVAGRRFPNTIAYESLHAARLYQAHNEFDVHDWGAREFVLPQDATSAVLAGDLTRLQPGDAIVFEEQISPRTGLSFDADPRCRQVVRVTQVTPTVDPLSESDAALWHVAWHPEDALQRPFHVSVRQGLRTLKRVSVVRGNLILADHGRTIVEEELGLSPARPSQSDRRAVLKETHLTFQSPYDHVHARRHSARAALSPAPAAAMPAIQLEEWADRRASELADERRTVWRPSRSLLDQDAYAPAFVVEMDDTRRANLRFGDGTHGLRPRDGAAYRAVYRLGGGQAGNLGRDAIGHVVAANPAIVGVRNPLPAVGGRDPQSAHDLRETPRLATRNRTSCLAPEDFADRAAQHPDVWQARADLRWTGAWQSVVLTVHRKQGRAVDRAFRDELLAFLEPYRVVGVELDVRGPILVPLDIRLMVFSDSPQHNTSTGRELQELLGNGRFGDGSCGFFHPDRLSLGQCLYPSQVVSLAMGVKGVRSVMPIRFRPYSADGGGPQMLDSIPLGADEVALVDNDLSAPERGLVIIELDPVVS